MFKALFTAGTGMKGQQFNVDTIANNLANINTNGYKRQKVDFQELLYTVLRSAGTASAQGYMVPTPLEVGSGVQIVGNPKVYTEGMLEQTGRDLDVAIAGDNGFFRIAMPDGSTAYTRDGAFQIDALTTNIVTSEGYPLADTVPIPSDATSINIGADGTVSVVTAADPNNATTVGQIQLAHFINPSGLESMGKNLLKETQASGTATLAYPGKDATGELYQGYIERSNVEMTTELVNLIIAQRAFEVNSRVIRAGDDMMQTANSITG